MIAGRPGSASRLISFGDHACTASGEGVEATLILSTTRHRRIAASPPVQENIWGTIPRTWHPTCPSV